MPILPTNDINALDATDANTVASHAAKLKASGIDIVALYYFKSSGFKHLLTRTVAEEVSKAGLKIISVYENGFPTSVDYFNRTNAILDAHVSDTRATDSGQNELPKLFNKTTAAGSSTLPVSSFLIKPSFIFYAIDYDVEVSQLSIISAYFSTLRQTLNSLPTAPNFNVGAYGSGLVLKHLTELGLISASWLAQSTGWQGYDEWLPKADIIQYKESNILGLDIDKDSVKPSARPWSLDLS